MSEMASGIGRTRVARQTAREEPRAQAEQEVSKTELETER